MGTRLLRTWDEKAKLIEGGIKAVTSKRSGHPTSRTEGQRLMDKRQRKDTMEKTERVAKRVQDLEVYKLAFDTKSHSKAHLCYLLLALLDVLLCTPALAHRRCLDVHSNATWYETAMEIYDISKRFPVEGKYSLTDQVRRSSRSICTNLAERWRKRKYKVVFINKLSDAAQEAAETQTWLEFSLHCRYMAKIDYDSLYDRYEHIFAMLNNMEKKADAFCI